MGLDVSGKLRYPPPDEQWLALAEEPVIDADMPIIDSHHHLWTENAVPYLGAEIMRDLASGHRVEATVFVQAHYGYRDDLPPELAPIGETEKVRGIAQACAASGCPTRVAAAIVAFADLTRGTEVARVLDAHKEAAQGSLCGIRHSVSRDSNFPEGIVLRPAPAGLLLDQSYRDGLRTLAAHGLSYDAMLYHQQIPELAATASAIPDLPIILDHLGTKLGVGPYALAERETFAQWRASMAELARCPNVSVKIGGMGMIICGARWHERHLPPTSQELADAWRPQVETCIEMFGPDRCMFESNFPVDKAMASYRTLWNAFKRITATASRDDREALFARTAARTYRIDMHDNRTQPLTELEQHHA
jgi:predicted TIM-barrel fold metal-dependent hydrolase